MTSANVSKITSFSIEDHPMAARRFQNILRGYRGTAAKQKLLDHYEGIGQGQGVGTGDKRPPSTKLYVVPFGADFPTGLFAQVSATTPAWTALGAIAAISARTEETIAGTATALKMKGFKAARVVRRSKADQTPQATVSKLTGLRYLKYNNPSISVPFGRDNATDTYLEARSAILTGIGNQFAVTFVDEDI
jgi:hypothetical protein